MPSQPSFHTFGNTSLAVIHEHEPKQIVAMSLKEFIDFLKEKGKNRFDHPNEIAKYLKKIARSSFLLD
jgi:hypothetical protein